MATHPDQMSQSEFDPQDLRCQHQPLIAYFSYHDALQEMLWTSFVYPTEALRDVPTAPIQRLASSASWWARIFAPYVPLLVLGVSALRRPFRPLLSRGITLYLLLACAVILVQKTSWWEYHFVLLFPPLGLLASLGLDRLLSLNPGQKLQPRVVVGLAGLLPLLPTLSLVRGMAGRLTRLVEASRLQTDASLPIRLDRQYLRIWERTRFLREDGGSRPGPIYVFGDARIVLLAERRQAISVHGHAWHHLPERFWQKLPAELIDAEPAYVFMGGFYRRLLRERSPVLWRHLREHYLPIRRVQAGRWYQRRSRKGHNRVERSPSSTGARHQGGQRTGSRRSPRG